MRAILSIAIALLLTAPALARPPDRIAEHRRAVDELSRHAHARSISRELSQMRSWIDSAAAEWRKGDKTALERTLVRLEAQAALARARLRVAAARSALARSEEELANMQHQIEAERRRLNQVRDGDPGGR